METTNPPVTGETFLVTSLS